VVYVGSGDSRLLAYDATTGALDWTATTGSAVLSSPAVANGVVYVGSEDGSMYAYAPTSTTPVCPTNVYVGLSPCQLQDAYKLPSQTAGAGRTVAIVDAYDDPNAEADLAVYRAHYGLPPCTTANGCFKKLNSSGNTSPLPANNVGWSQEISLDLDVVSAACPLCHITLVEADNNGNSLYVSQATAAAQHPTAISNSWGSNEFANENLDDSLFSFPGIPVTVSTGDNGYGVSYPAAASTVTAVGGTVLQPDASARHWSEAAWSGSGSGCSAIDPKPAWQTDSGCARRTNADVSALGGPPGVSVYDTNGEPGWINEWGTSLASPLVASVYALAYPDYTQATTYTHTSSLFDITSGSTGSCGGSYLCNAVAGFDGPTGLGTPCGIGAFGSGPGAATCPPVAAAAASPAASRLIAETTPSMHLTPACAPVPAGQSRCFAEKATPLVSIDVTEVSPLHTSHHH